MRWSVAVAIAFTASGTPLAAQSDRATEHAALDAEIAEAGTACIGYSLAVQDVARENGIEDPRLLGSRAKTAQSVTRLAVDQDTLDEKSIYLEAIRWRDTFFRPAAEIVIPGSVSGQTASDSEINIMREGQRNCQEWNRLVAQRAALNAADKADE